MSGRNQNTFGLWANTVDAGFGSNTLPPRPLVTTIAEHVKELGYITGMSGKWHLGNLEDPKTNPGGRGFDWYFTGMVNQFFTNVNRADGSLLPSMTHVADRRNRIDVTGEMVERFVDRHVLSNWFFYWAPYGPHHPMLEDGDHFLEAFRKMGNFKPYPFYSAEENDARLRGLALVHAIDTRMGNIVQNLRRHKIEQNTLILFASDNGAPMGMSYVEGQTRFRRDIWREVQPSPLPSPGLPAGGDYLPYVRDPSSSYVGSENVPLRGGKGTTWQGGIKIPMFAYWKGTIPPGQVFHQVVTTLDLTATVAHAAGMAVLPEKDFDGVSLLNSLRTKTQPASFTSQQHWFGVLGDAAVQKHGMKLRRSHNTFLFNVTHDPYELFNLAGSHQGNSPQILATLNSELDKWLHTLPFEKPCGTGCLAEDMNSVRHRWQSCTASEIDSRFHPKGGSYDGSATCWPAAITDEK